MQYLPAEQRSSPLYELAPERTLFVFSTAKVLADGLRIGVLCAPQAVRICVGAAADQASLKRALSILRASLEQPPLATATV
ncbi:hypothetical protein [Vreelandella venusta]|uniref:hypothetical protein n=1 Tax=Vreelandella venusta TaxID=44935 RepID=UPI003851075D